MNGPRLTHLLAHWEEAYRHGHDIPARELCPDGPELADELQLAIEVLRRLIDRSRADLGSGEELLTTVMPPADAPRILPIPFMPESGVERIPGYEILEELGRGAMGVVYKARQVSINRLVALKRIQDQEFARADELSRFRSEAEALARLQHPGIVQVFEVGESRGHPFFSLEYCPEGSLDKKLAGTPIEPEVAARLVQTLARAMHAAHQANVIHRDLKPGNILLVKANDESIGLTRKQSPLAGLIPKVTDFGLAKKLDESGQTQTGAVMGTPSYMAPEQAEGRKDVGPLADVYALGAILYECLTGRPPFRAATLMDTLMQVVHQEPVPPRQLNARVPRDLETIALKCLAKSPAARYASAKELADDLGRWLGGESILARPVGRLGRLWRWCRREPVLASLIAATTAAVAAVIAILLVAQDQQGRINTKLKNALDDNGKLLTQTDEARRTAERNLARVYVANGVNEVNANRLDRALPWLARALETDAESADTPLHRGRLHAMLRACPRLVQMHFLPQVKDAPAILLSPPGDRLYLPQSPTMARLRDTLSGKEVGPPLEWPSAPNRVVFHPGGEFVVGAMSIGKDKSARVRLRALDVRTGRSPAGAKGTWTDVEQEGTLVKFEASGCGRYLLLRTHIKASESGVLSVRDAFTGRPMFAPLTISAHAPVALSPDGKFFAVTQTVSITIDGPKLDLKNNKDLAKVLGKFREMKCKIDLRDPASGRLVRTLEASSNHIEQAVFHPQSRYLATAYGDFDSEVNLFDLVDPTTPRRDHTSPGFGFSPRLTFHPAGHVLQVDSNLGSSLRLIRDTYFLDPATGKPVDFSFPRPPGVVLRILSPYSGSGRYLVLGQASTGQTDHVAWVYDLFRRELVARPMAHEQPIREAAFILGDRYVMTRDEHTVRIWDVWATGHDRDILPDGEEIAGSLFSADGKRVALIRSQQKRAVTIRLHETDTLRPIGPALAADAMPRNGKAILTPDGRFLVGVVGDRLWLWDLEQGSKRSLLSPEDKYNEFHFVLSGDGRRLFYCVRRSPYVLHALDLDTGKQYLGEKVARIEQSIQAIYPAPDGKQVIISQDKRPQFLGWDVETGRSFSIDVPFERLPDRVAWAPDGRSFLASSIDRSRVVDVATGKVIRTLPVGVGGGGSVFSPDGKLVFTPGRGVWNFTTGESVVQGTGEGQGIFSADSRFLLVTLAERDHSNDGTPADLLRPIMFRMFETDDYHTAQVWDTATGQPLTPRIDLYPLPRHLIRSNYGGRTLPGLRCRMTPDGTRLLIEGGWPRIIELRPDAARDRDLLTLARLHSGRRGNASGASAAANVPEPDDWPTALAGQVKAMTSAQWHQLSEDGAWRLFSTAGDREPVRHGATPFARRFHLDQRLLLEPDNLSLYSRRASLREQAGDLAGALADNTRVVELDPSSANARMQRGYIHARLGKWPQAAADFRKGVELESNGDLYGFYIMMATLTSAIAGEDAAYRKLCADLFALALKRTEKSPGYYLGVLLALRPNALKDYPAAIRQMRKWMSEKPHPDGHLGVGALLARAGSPEEAIRELQLSRLRTWGDRYNRRTDLALAASSVALASLAGPARLAATLPGGLPREKDDPTRNLWLALAHSRAGNPEAARAALARLPRERGKGAAQWKWVEEQMIKMLRDEIEGLLRDAK